MKEKKLDTSVIPPTLFYCNPLFDLSLGNYTPPIALMRAAAEMSTLFVPCAHAHDKIILSIAVPHDYWEYLSRQGINCPESIRVGQPCRGMYGIPWGWNQDALDKFRLADAQCMHPDLSVVRQVNTRAFSFQFNQDTGTGVPGACYCTSQEELIQKLKSWYHVPFVIKPDFGNAGYGFLRKETPVLSENECRQLDTFFTGENGVVIEPWYTRQADISSRAVITHAGTIEDVKHHRTLSNSAGTFFADLFDPNDRVVAPWKEQLNRAVHAAAHALHKAGYFGPAGFDSFDFVDSKGDKHLAPVVEINARHPMSSVAYALRDTLAPNRVTLFRFIGKKKHRLPQTYALLDTILGKYAFDPDIKRGVVLVTPLRVCHNDRDWIQPARSAFFLAEESSEKVLALDEKMRGILKDFK